MPDPNAPAAHKPLKYIGTPGEPVGGGLPAADVTADQASAWYTQAAVDEAVNVVKSHAVANDADGEKIEAAAQQRADVRQQHAQAAVEAQQGGRRPASKPKSAEREDSSDAR